MTQVNTDIDLPNYLEYNCNQLLALYFTDPYCKYDKYIHAYSFDIKILQNLIEINISVEEKKYYSIEPVKFCHYLTVGKSDSVDDFFGKKNVNGIVVENPQIKFKEAQNNIYGYYCKNNITFQEEQVLLLCKYIENFTNNNNISSNPVIIDTFYEEGIMNA